MTAGYWLAKFLQLPKVELVVIGIVFLSILPLWIGVAKGWRCVEKAVAVIKNSGAG